MAANPLSGEAELDVGGKTHLVKVNMRSVPIMFKALGVTTWDEFAGAAQKIESMLPLTLALLEGNKVPVTEDDVAEMDFGQWHERIMPALFRYKPKGSDEGAGEHPTKSQRKR